MKKIGSLITACCLSLGMCSMLAPQSFSASAASDSANPNAYTLRIVPERTTVSSEELAAGDVIIPASIYITGSTENQVQQRRQPHLLPEHENGVHPIHGRPQLYL